MHGTLSTAKGLLGKLLYIGLGNVIVHDGLLSRILCFCRLETLNQRLGVGEGIVVGRMEALADNLIDSMVFAYRSWSVKEKKQHISGPGGTNTSRRWLA